MGGMIKPRSYIKVRDLIVNKDGGQVETGKCWMER